VQIIDAARVLPVLSEVSQAWRPSKPIPADLDRSSRFIREYHDGLADLLDRAVREERDYQVKRYRHVAKLLSAEEDPPDVIASKHAATSQALRRALDVAVGAGVLQGAQNDILRDKLEEFDAVDLQQWAESIQRVSAEQDPALLLAELSLVPVGAARVSTELLEIVETMLTRTEAAARRGLGKDEAEGEQALVDAQRAIGDGLQRLIHATAELVSAEGG